MKNSLNDATRGLITRILGEHRLMTIATNRPDGWPQATTVGYVNEGLLLYCFVGRTSQKYMNIDRDRRVSISIAGEFTDPAGIKGLSLGGLAETVQDRQDYMKFWRLFRNRCPGFASWPEPTPAMAPLLCITPVVISVVDYSKGFGHSELVSVSNADLWQHATAAIA